TAVVSLFEYLALPGPLQLRVIAAAREPARGDRPEDKAAHVSGIGHPAARGLLRDGAETQELDQAPYTDEHHRGNIGDPHEHEDHEQGANLVLRKSDQESAHH